MGRSKALERRYAEHLAEVLRPIVNGQFDGNQTRASAAMGIAQSHLSQILMGEGAGIAVLIRIRAFTKLSLDELLGLSPLGAVAGLPDGTRLLDALRQAVTELERQQGARAGR